MRKTEASWLNLTIDYGKWGTVHQRFIRWQKEQHLINATYVKDHKYLCDARRENQVISKTKWGLIRKYT